MHLISSDWFSGYALNCITRCAFIVKWLLEYVHCWPKLSSVFSGMCVVVLLWRPGCYGDQVFIFDNGSRLCSTVTHCCFHIRFEERRRELGWRIKEREKKERKRGGEEKGVRVEG